MKGWMIGAIAGLGALMIGACASAPPSYDGAALYQNHCAACHGVYGEGDGPVAPYVSVELNDLRRIARRYGSFPRDLVTQIIDGREFRPAHGPRDMPIWGAEFQRMDDATDASERRARAKIDAIVDFLQSIQLATDA